MRYPSLIASNIIKESELDGRETRRGGGEEEEEEEEAEGVGGFAL